MQSLVRKLRTLFHPRKYALKPVLSPASDRYGKEQVERSGNAPSRKDYDNCSKNFFRLQAPREPWSFHLADCFYPIPALYFAETFAALPA